VNKDNRNRPDSKSATDDWLTPKPVVDDLGPFDLDPCCYPRMPWRTAKRMISNGVTVVDGEPRKLKVAGGVTLGDGLDPSLWKRGRKWVNPPYSRVLPWVQLLAEHGDGFMLVPAKSMDTAWAQLLMETADEVLFQRGRFEFCLPTGEPSGGAWGPSMVAAYGKRNVRDLRAALGRGSVLRGVVAKALTTSEVTEKLMRKAG
jgi:hypothetical protein